MAVGVWQIANVSADDQALTPLATLTPAGELDWTGAAWIAYTPTVTVASGAGNASGRYKKMGKTVAIKLQVNITTRGCCNR